MWMIALACAGSSETPESPLLEQAWAQIAGTAEQPVGSAVFGLGDLDGDGADELGLGWTTQGLEDNPPQLSLFRGLRAGEADITQADLWLRGDTRVGWLVALTDCPTPRAAGHLNVLSLGDLDGDGLPELALGLTEGGGQVVVHLGSTLWDGRTEQALLEGRWNLYGSGDYEFGTDLAVGHFDPDGLPDLAIGAPVSSSPARGGRVYLVSGRRLAGLGAQGVLAADIGAVVYGPVEGAMLGDRLVTVPDLDADGIDELAMLSPGCGGLGLGSVVLERGRDLPRPGRWAPPVPWGVYSAQDELRANLQSLGDTDGDGLAELALGGVSGSSGEQLVVFSGASLAAGGELGPSSGFQTGQDSRHQLQPWPGAQGQRLLVHDGEAIIPVEDPLSAWGWYKSSPWPALCPQDEPLARQRLLATGDFDGDGALDLAVGEPLWPTCDEDEENTGLVVLLRGD